MKTPNCPQLWKVEAVRDRRLVGSEAAAFDRHTAVCGRCSSEVSSLRTLSSLLTELPMPEVDPVSARRMRQRLLEDANTAALGLRPAEPRPRSFFRPFATVAVFAAAAAAFAAVAGRLHHTAPLSAALSGSSSPALSVAAEPSQAGSLFAEVWSSPNTRWSRRTEGPTEHIQLDQGTLTVRTSHEKGAAQLSFEMPDGRLVDRGTTFEVRVEGGHTERVRVLDGSVAVRLNGRAEFIVNAGQSWARNGSSPDVGTPANVAPANAPANTVDAPPAAPVKGPAEASPKRTAAAPASRPATTARAERSSNGTASSNTKDNEPETRSPSIETEEAPHCPASKSMDSGLAFLASNRYQAAASAFGRFASTCATDRRAEDAAYLRVVALARAGDIDQAREAAHSYLGRFPHGFRRTEVEKLVAAP